MSRPKLDYFSLMKYFGFMLLTRSVWHTQRIFKAHIIHTWKAVRPGKAGPVMGSFFPKDSRQWPLADSLQSLWQPLAASQNGSILHPNDRNSLYKYRLVTILLKKTISPNHSSFNNNNNKF